MDNIMIFPNTVEEFMEQHKVIDTEQIYSNGTEFVPIFRMRQWFEHLRGQGMAYISREAALDFLIPLDGTEVTPVDARVISDRFEKFLCGIPAANVRPVVRGKWVHGREIARTILADKTIAIEYEDWHCSECGVVVEDWEFPRYKYCPNCGADMRGDNNE